MNKTDNKSSFCCKSVIPASVKEDLSCIDNKCPAKIPTKRFSSPTTQLSLEEFEKQKRCIEEVNSLLVAISSPRNPENLSGLRLHFKKLKGMIVKVEIEYSENKENILGIIKNAGRDHLEIKSGKKTYFVLYKRICKVSRKSSHDDCVHLQNHGHGELQDIDKCLRRDIALNFGETVSKNPKLINIFFGIPLYLQLVNYINFKVKVRVVENLEVIEGILVETINDKICIKTQENKIEEINITDICLITID